MFRAGVGDS